MDAWSPEEEQTSPSSRPESSTLVIRNWVNWASGWLVAVGLLVLVLATDAMHLYSRYDDAPDETPWQALPWYLPFAAIGLGAFAVFARPRVEVTADSVWLRNVVRDVFIPVESIQSVDDSGQYLVIAAGGRDYTAAGTEASNLTMLLGRQGTADALGTALADVRPIPPLSARAVSEKWRPAPRGGELALWLACLLYPCAALIRQVIG